MLIISKLRALRPGGWLELCDFKYPMDGIARQYSALHRWNELLMEASERLGIPLTCTRNYRTQMVQAGFRRVQEQVYHWPLGAWEKGGKNQYIGKQAKTRGLCRVSGCWQQARQESPRNCHRQSRNTRPHVFHQGFRLE